MKKIICSLLLLAAISTEAFAVPAINRPVKRTLPDGSEITIRVYGDEFYSYKTTIDGYNIVEDADGYFYYAAATGSVLKSVGVRANDPARRTKTDAAALRSVRKGVAGSVAMQANRAARKERGVAEPNKVGEMYDRNGRLRTLVILVSFADKDFSVSDPKTAFSNLLNEDGYSRNGSTGSAWNYYHDNSFGQFNPEFDVVGPYKLSRTRAYYGAQQTSGSTTSSDVRAAQMAYDACRAADSDVDFAEYSENGVVRDVFIFYAGANEAEGADANTIWPHRWQFYVGSNIDENASLLIDGVRLRNYACSSELRGSNDTPSVPDNNIANIGTFCHEFGHVLGWCDYYVTDGSDTGAVTPRSMSLMSSGNYLNESRTPPSTSAFDRYLVGWLTPDEISASGNYSLGTLNATNKAFMIRSGVDGESFFIENRDKTSKWDTYMTGEYADKTYQPSTVDGLLVYHIDRSDSYISNWYSNSPNNDGRHECMKIVRSDNTSKSPTRWFFPGLDKKTSINSTDVPEYLCWSGKSNGINISDLTIDAAKTATFTVTVNGAGSLTGKVVDLYGNGLASATVALYAPKSAPSKGGLRAMTLTSGAALYSATTDVNGNFNLTDIESRDYTLEITLDGYCSHTAACTVIPTSNTYNVTMVRSVVEENMTHVKWYTDINSAIGNGGQPLIGAAKFLLADIPVTTDAALLAGVEMQVYATCTATAVVFLNNNKVGSKSCGEIVKGSRVYADLTSLNIHIGANDQLIVGFEVTEYDVKGYPFFTDEGPLVEGKGNLVSEDGGKNWQYFPENANLIIGAYFSFPQADGAELAASAKTLYVGDCLKLHYTVQPTGSKAVVDWISSDNDVVVVEDDVITARKVGTTEVSGSFKSSTLGPVSVTVLPEIEQIDITTDQASMSATVKWTSKAERSEWVVRYSTATEVTKKKVTSNKCEVVLEGLEPETDYNLSIGGKRSVDTYDYWGYTDKTFRSAKALDIATITFDKAELEIQVDATRTLKATFTPEKVYDSTLLWSSSDQTVATVSAEGVLKGVGVGTAVITVKAKTGSASATCNVKVVKGMGELTVVEYGQHDALLSWQGSPHTGDWRIDVQNRNSGITESTTQQQQTLFLDHLNYDTAYDVTVTAILSDGSDGAQNSIEVVTLAKDGRYPKMLGVKGSYAADDDITLRVGNITGTIERVDWTADGAAVTAPHIKLKAGSHTIVATVTTVDGKVQKFIKFITVK